MFPGIRVLSKSQITAITFCGKIWLTALLRLFGIAKTTTGTVPSMFDVYTSCRRVDSGGVSLNVADHGPPDGEPVLMLHGFPDSARLWRNQIPALVEAGYRVIAPDLRGFGRSDLRSEEHTSELQSRPHLVCRLLLEKKKKDTL